MKVRITKVQVVRLTSEIESVTLKNGTTFEINNKRSVTDKSLEPNEIIDKSILEIYRRGFKENDKQTVILRYEELPDENLNF